jgi:5-(carboxyamino)imidazole ribonucleotide synthase
MGKTMNIGILGGGQLGRMLLQAAANYDVTTHVLENDPECPAAHLCHHFTKGDIKDFDTVYQFGKSLDALTIEIEAVNVDALEKLEQEGVKVYPNSKAIRTIKNKVLQKQFYATNEIPTAAFQITQHQSDLLQHINFLPAVHKLGEGGYDGKGVQVIENESEIELGFNVPSVLEKKVSIHKEIALIIARNDKGDSVIYPACEMIFDPVYNLLDYQLSPAKLEQKQIWKAEAIARKIVNSLQSPGLFAIELFIDKEGDVWVNETAPRVHNSGHHTIEANYSSQYDMLWRIMLGFPLGNTDPILPSSIVNIIGAENYSGDVYYEGLEEVLAMDNVFVHLYGKKQTKPGRKMGHVTIISNDYLDLTHKANKIKNKLKAITK